MRPLSPDEAELWARVTATIAPLSRQRSDVQAPDKTKQSEPAKVVVRAGRAAAKAVARLGTTLDGNWDRRLSSGAIEPDRILDLHGMTLDSAWRAIDQTLDLAIGKGERVVLLITGHHRSGAPPVQRGRIRAAVHDWLEASRHAGQIAAVRGANRRHGGGGSLYIILRRR